MPEVEELYSAEEKLALVSEGLMDPKEIGLVSKEEALKLLPEAPKRPVFGTTILFRAGVVPMELRTQWAKEENKILPFDEAAWAEEHKSEYPIQAEVHCGNTVGKFSQTFQDPVLGLAQMMREAADRLELAYTKPDTIQPEEENAQNISPIIAATK